MTRIAPTPHASPTPTAHVDFEGWRQFCSDSLMGDDVWPIENEDHFSGEFDRRWIDDCLVVRCSASPYHGSFRRNSQASDYLAFSISWPPTGEDFVLRTEEQVRSSDTRMGLWDHASIHQFAVNIRRDNTYVFVPKDALRGHGVRLSTLSQPTGVDARPTAQVLAGVLSSILDQPAPLAPADSSAIRSAILNLFAGTSRDVVLETSGAVSAMMRQRVEQWIAANVSTGPVSPAAAANAHGISVRSLHRLFSETSETYGDVVRAVRLDGARQELASSSATVQTIATRWGYADVSHFCREFKRSFGMTTGDFRKSLHAPRYVA
ncbi:helix-turn-helix transcriptional regulator [Nocardioides sp. CER19]|uniref:helix-turn-helix transcriptional regulator n=1 Tax=Nocardioides sp. CER19 TaxID=3038538 RepID=UPI002447339C|nr:helix-turn-helix transcriptional regulator [Nocardioides sp. CER19]MDH2416143.1 helix-turn-helix transcriptional regulator [Nocardioides sp. CER19]